MCCDILTCAIKNSKRPMAANGTNVFCMLLKGISSNVPM